MQDVASYEATQETLALLKILALGRRQVEQGKTVCFPRPWQDCAHAGGLMRFDIRLTPDPLADLREIQTGSCATTDLPGRACRG